MRKVHLFDNGVKVYDYHLSTIQRNRYHLRNVHEAEEEDIFVQIIQTIRPKGYYLNIGSAIGYYPLLAKKLVPELIIHAIEPLKRHRDFFMENIILNGFKDDDFIIQSNGVSSANSWGKFLDDGYGSSIQQKNKVNWGLKSIINFFLTFSKTRNNKKISYIKTITLDKILSKAAHPIELCQMDVQGSEVDILNGAKKALQKGSIKIFLIGTHSRILHQDCIDILISNGYLVEFEEQDPKIQPDGIIVASKGTKVLITSNNQIGQAYK